MQERTKQPRSGATTQDARTPLLDGFERPWAPRASRGRGREPRDKRERLSGSEWPSPRPLAVDIPCAAGRSVGTEHREPEIAAHLGDARGILHPYGGGFDGTMWRLQRRDQAAEAIGLLDDLDGHAGRRQVVRGREPGESTSDNRDGPH